MFGFRAENLRLVFPERAIFRFVFFVLCFILFYHFFIFGRH